jgi:DNA-binding CsgD family transcriptional regulator
LLAVIIEARPKAVARSRLWRKTVALTEREVEVLTWVVRGKTSAEIAQILGADARSIFTPIMRAANSARSHAPKRRSKRRAGS